MGCRPSVLLLFILGALNCKVKAQRFKPDTLHYARNVAFQTNIMVGADVKPFYVYKDRYSEVDSTIARLSFVDNENNKQELRLSMDSMSLIGNGLFRGFKVRSHLFLRRVNGDSLWIEGNAQMGGCVFNFINLGNGAPGGKFTSSGDKIGYLKIEGSPNLVLFDDSVGTFDCTQCLLKNISLTHIKTKKMLLREVDVQGKFFVQLGNLPDTLDISYLKFLGDSTAKVVLSDVPAASTTCHLSIIGTSIEKIELRDYLNFQLYFPKKYKLKFEDKVGTYQQLLNRFEQTGMLDSYEKLDKEFKQLKHTDRGNWYGEILNFADSWLWDYGYENWWVIVWAFVFYSLACIFNFFWFNKLIKIYKLDKFDSFDKKQKSLRKKVYKGYIICIYTGYIYWGLRLDLSKLKIDSRWSVWILIQYGVGILFLALIANVIATFTY